MQIVLAPRSASVPEVPRLPPHLATGPPSPKRHPSGALTGGRRSGLEVAAGGVAKRSGVSRRDEEMGSQRAGEDGPKPKPKRAAGQFRFFGPLFGGHCLECLFSSVTLAVITPATPVLLLYHSPQLHGPGWRMQLIELSHKT